MMYRLFKDKISSPENVDLKYEDDGIYLSSKIMAIEISNRVL